MALALPVVFAGWQAPRVLQGTVRRADTDLPLAGAVVQVLATNVATVTNAQGEFSLNLPVGRYAVSVAHSGFIPRTLDITIGTGGLRVDVDLTRAAQSVPPLYIRDTAGVTGDGAAARRRVETRAGDRAVDAETIRGDPTTAEPDAIRALAGRPDVGIAPESPTALRVRGGSADQTAVYVNDVPLYFVSHAGGVLSPVSPALVSRSSVSAGVPSARYGGAISGTVNLRTAETTEGRAVVSGSVTPRLVELSAEGPIPGVAGSSISISGRGDRQSAVSLISGEATGQALGFNDFFLSAVKRFSRSRIEALVIGGAERLRFASGGQDSAAASPPSGAGASPEESGALENRFDWRTTTAAVLWRQESGSTMHLSARAWRTQYDAAARWASPSAATDLASGLRESGFAADFEWGQHASGGRAGGFLSRYDVSYVVSPVVPGGAVASNLLSLGSSPLVGAAYLERYWEPMRGLSVVGGVRAVTTDVRRLLLEPRVAVRYSTAPWLSVSVSAGRQHQFVQSLRNEESLTDSFLGLSFPAAAAAGGVPVAMSDQVALSVESALSPGWRASVDGYVRSLSGLALVAPLTGAPFATRGIVPGRGRAVGLALFVEYRGPRVSGQLGYAVSDVTRSAPGVHYRPAFAVGQSAVAGASYRLPVGVVVRIAARAALGRPSSALADDIEWDPAVLAQHVAELAGTPEQLASALDGVRLAPYARLDFGLRRTWRFGAAASRSELGVAVDVRNVTDRRNVLGVVHSGGLVRDLNMQPRTAFLSVWWRF
ncbi:MAG: TonB-dependent receptor [Gemmatimonadota bacterium]|nr:TonB-dependent receptor [Gemmatimonadota bacterium]